jgi:hypothetical protein
MTDPGGETLESAFERTERDASGAIRASAAVLAQLKRAKKAAETGAIRDLERALEAAEQLAGAMRDAIRSTRTGWTFDERQYLASGRFTQEVLDLARERGVAIQEQDDRIVSYPSLVRVLPDDSAIEIDRKKHRSIRPSKVVDVLKAAQEKPPRFSADRFIEGLLRAYSLVLADDKKETGTTASLLDVYRVLTVFPGHAAAYSKQEFARDIYLLDESGVNRTRSGLTMTLPAATGARTNATLVTVTKTGGVQVYFGIAFR